MVVREKKLTRLIAVLLTLAAVSVVCTGCMKQGEYLTDEGVIAEVEKYTGTEKVTIVDKVQETGRIDYYMKTDIRGLEFKVDSHPVGTSGGFNFAHAGIYDYLHAIHDPYMEEIRKKYNNGEDTQIVLKFYTMEELKDVVSKLKGMDDIYREELEYHDEEWLKKFPVTTIVLSHRKDTDEKSDFSYGVKIDGTIDEDEMEQFLCDLYLERTGKTFK